MLPAARRVVPTLVRSAATVMLGTLLAVLPDVALSLLRPAAVPVAHAQFGGCPVSGTWIGGPSGFDYRWSLKEDGGVVSGSTIPVGDTDPTHALIASTGSRSGASVSIAFTTGGTGVPLLGTMSDCDHIDAQVNGQTFTIARVDVAYCGDGLPDAGEACDDDNFTNGDTCTVLCANQSCGNRVVEPGEACDDGNLVQVDGCSNACQSNACGNGVVESGEQCDDGNQVNGDGCSRTCAPNVCGNGVVESGERCDDGLPPANGDGCSTLCQFEGCDMSGTWQVASGGIGTFFLREDASHQIDGNSFSFGFDPTSAQRVTSGNRNGNAVLLVQGTIGAVGEMTSCSTVALSVPSLGISLTLTRLSTSFCGDGVEDAGEECDDGNFANGDACTASCTEPRCGNRISEPGETCDDGNLVPADGCSNDCQVNHCGDGSNPPEPGEECDDGNLTDGDGCSKQCRVNLCGNGIIEPGEQCDDGDLPPAGGDGCSTLCQFEGCPVTGVWVVDGGATNEVERLVEGPGGAITGFHGEPTAATPSFTITGTRIGGSVSALLLSGGSPTAVATLSQTDCDHVAGTATLPGAGGATVPLSMTRISSGDCGDGAKSGGEQCDDGNTAGNDDCNFACQLPHCGDGPPLDPYETCDDGNGNPNDACKNDCTPNVCGDGVQNVGVEQCDDGNASDEDACKTDCTLNVCGDGKLLAGVEACDDGDTEPSDGCDETCNVEEIQVAALPASGGTVSTDPENDGATPDDPMETAITVPANGTSVVVSIAETSATVPTSGYFALGKQVNITVPPTTAQTPMSFVFSLDASVVPPGQDATTIVVFRNGTPVPNCLGASQAVPFDPCVTAREQLGDGDVRITVLTSRASAWSLAARRPLPGAQEAACRKEIRKQVSTLFQKRLGVLARCEDLVRKGKATAPCPDGDALARIAAAEAKVDPTKLEKKCAATLIGTLGLTGSCSAATSPATLAACLVAAAASATDELADAEYATPAATITDKALLSCQATIAKESGKKFAPKRLKIFDACNGKLDADKVAACLDPTSSAQLGDAEGKLAAGIGGHCTDVQVTALGTFGGPCATASDVASLVGCQLATHRARTDQILSLLP